MNLYGTNVVTGLYTFYDTDGSILANGWVTTYLAGTTTKQATYTDSTLGTPNTNPLQLNSLGQAVMFFASYIAGSPECVAYKVLLQVDNSGVPGATVSGYPIDQVSVPAPSASANLSSAVVGYGALTTLSIAGGLLTPTKNIHLASGEGGMADNLDSIAVTALPDGSTLILGNSSGSAAITVRSGIGNILLSSSGNFTLSATSDRLELIRNGANWQEVTRSPAGSSSGAVALLRPGGRLTLTSGTPVLTSPVTGATTLYYTPYLGNSLPLYNGSSFDELTFAELSIAVPATTDTMYDVFAYNNSGTAALELLAWSNLTTRATGLQRLNGWLCKSGALTRLYLGSFSTGSSSGQTQMSDLNPWLYNYYNRVDRVMAAREATASWSYSTGAYRQANGSTSNQVSPVVGVSEDAISLLVRGNALIGTIDPTALIYVSIGIDSTTAAATGVVGQMGANATYSAPMASLTKLPDIGRRAYVWLEYGPGSTTTWYGANPASQVQSGITATLLM